MAADIIERGRLTDLLLAHLIDSEDLELAGILVGDGMTPARGGWTEGQPNVGTFVPSVTLETLDATVRDRDTVRSRHASWNCRYGLRYQGGVRSQADSTADLVRAVVLEFRGTALDGPWQLNDVLFTQLAPVVPNRSSDPPTWEMSDVVQLWVDRKRA